MSLASLAGARIPHGRPGGGDPDFANVGYLLHFDDILTPNAFPDVIGNTWARNGATAANSFVSGDNPMFGPGSLRVRMTGSDANSCSIVSTVTPYVMSPTNTFTIEGFVYWNGSVDAQTMIGAVNTSVAVREIRLYVQANADVLRLDAIFNGTLHTLTASPASNAYQFAAGTFDGTTLRLFAGPPGGTAVLLASSTVSPGASKTVTGYEIGFFTGANHSTPSFVDEARFTFNKCRYTTDFLVPTEAFPDFL